METGLLIVVAAVAVGLGAWNLVLGRKVTHLSVEASYYERQHKATQRSLVDEQAVCEGLRALNDELNGKLAGHGTLANKQKAEPRRAVPRTFTQARRAAEEKLAEVGTE